MYKLSFLFLLLTSHAVAQNAATEAVLELIDKTNQKSLSPEPKKDCCTTNVDQPSVINQCAIELCGKPTPQKSVILSDANFQYYAKPEALKRFGEIENEIKELVKKETEKNNELIKRLLSQEENNQIKIDFVSWTDDDFESVLNQVYDDHAELLLDKTKKFPERIEYKVNYPKNVSSDFKAGLDEYAKMKKEKLLADPKECIYNDCYSDEEGHALIAKVWNDFQPKFEEIRKSPSYNQSYKEMFDTVLADFANIPKDNYKRYSLLHFMDFAESAYRSLKQDYTPYDPKTFYICKGAKCRLGVKDFLKSKNLKKMITELKQLNESPEILEDRLNNCKSELASKHLKDTDVEAFKKIIVDVKSKFLKNVTTGYSAHSKTSLKKYLDDLHHSFKDDNASEDEFIKEIQDQYKNSLATNTSTATQKEDILSLLRLDEGDMGGLNPLSQLYSCSSMFSTAWDAFAAKEDFSETSRGDVDVTKNNLFVSHFSCTYHTSGKQIYAHELGHALSNAFRTNLLSKHSFVAYKELRSCANSHHLSEDEYPASVKYSHPGDKYRTEEDTADLVAFLVFPEEEMFECALINTSDDGTQYKDLSLKNPIARDSHSAPLFRVLQEAVHKKKTLPESCKKVINENPNFGFKPCF